MNESLAFYATTTVPAFPLGKPLDGRARYSMTLGQAMVYRWLVQRRPHDEGFQINFRHMAALIGDSLNIAHCRVQGLVERGWLTPHGHGRYSFVHPVMHFGGPRNG